MTKRPFLALVLIAAGGVAQAGERAAAVVACDATQERLSYTCAITLKGRKSGDPILADRLLVKPAMPSMMMAHNLPPAIAMPVDGKPGHYMTSFELEMFGEWSLAIEVNGKLANSGARVRDKVIVKREFGAPSGEGDGQRKATE